MPPGVTCYGIITEKARPVTEIAHEIQGMLFKYLPVSEIVKDFKRFKSKKKFDKKTKQYHEIAYLRFSQDADFIDQETVDKLFEVAKELPDIRVYGYTCRTDLDFSKKPDNVVINISGINYKVAKYLCEKITCPGDCRTCKKCTLPNANVVAEAIKKGKRKKVV